MHAPTITCPQRTRPAIYPQFWHQAVWYRFATIMVMAMTLRLDSELDEKLTELAQRTGLSKQRLIVEAIEALVRNQEKRQVIGTLVREVAVRDAELLERLSDS